MGHDGQAMIWLVFAVVVVVTIVARIQTYTHANTHMSTQILKPKKGNKKRIMKRKLLGVRAQLQMKRFAYSSLFPVVSVECGQNSLNSTATLWKRLVDGKNKSIPSIHPLSERALPHLR